MKYRKKPIIIEAIQWSGENFSEIERFMAGAVPHRPSSHSPGIFFINTLEGIHTVSLGDFIIQGIKGEFYPCKPDIFEATYEEVEKQEGANRTK